MECSTAHAAHDVKGVLICLASADEGRAGMVDGILWGV